MDERKVEVFLISSIPYRSSDLIVSFLSADYGKLTAVVYGGKKVGKSGSFGYQVGDRLLLDCQKFENKDFIKILAHSPLKHNAMISENYNYYLFHCYLHEIVNKMANPEHPERNLFNILNFYQTFTWEASRSKKMIVLLLWRIILHSGLAIHYSTCSSCEKDTFMKKGNQTIFRKEHYQLLPDSGELRCSDCSGVQLSGQGFTPGMIKLLWMMDNDAPSFLDNANIPSEILVHMTVLFSSYLTDILGVKLHSKELFLKSVKM